MNTETKDSIYSSSWWEKEKKVSVWHTQKSQGFFMEHYNTEQQDYIILWSISHRNKNSIARLIHINSKEKIRT